MGKLVIYGTFALLLASFVDFTNAGEINIATDVVLPKLVEREATVDSIEIFPDELVLRVMSSPKDQGLLMSTCHRFYDLGCDPSLSLVRFARMDSLERPEASLALSRRFPSIRLIRERNDQLEDYEFQVIGDHSYLTTLLMPCSYIKAEQFAQLTSLISLTYLDMSMSKIKALGSIVSPLTNLNKLNISHNKGLKNKFQALTSLINLASLKAEKTYISSKDIRTLVVLTTLRELDIQRNFLRRKHMTPLNELTNLTHLNLGYNFLDTKDISLLCKLPQLIWLDVACVGFPSIRHEIEHLTTMTALRHLGVRGNRLFDIRTLASLTHLDSLDISDNGLLGHSYIAPLTSLFNLKFLDVSENDGLRGSDLSVLSSLIQNGLKIKR